MNAATVNRAPLFADAGRAAALRAAAVRWDRTPWRHCGAEPGQPRATPESGGDCVHVLVAVLIESGAVRSAELPAYQTPLGYGQGDGPALLAHMDSLCRAGALERINARALLAEAGLLTGDLLVFHLGAYAHHLGLYDGGRNDMFWHSVKERGWGRSSLRETQYRAGLRTGYRLLDGGNS